MYGFTYPVKALIDVCIGISHHTQPHLPQIGTPSRIISLACLIIMLRSVDFDHQLGRGTIKIYNIWSNNALFINFYGMLLQKQLQKLALLRSHFAAQFASIGKKLVVLWYFHMISSQSAALTVLPKGEPRFYASQKLLIVDITPPSTFASMRNSPFWP